MNRESGLNPTLPNQITYSILSCHPLKYPKPLYFTRVSCLNRTELEVWQNCFVRSALNVIWEIYAFSITPHEHDEFSHWKKIIGNRSTIKVENKGLCIINPRTICCENLVWYFYDIFCNELLIHLLWSITAYTVAGILVNPLPLTWLIKLGTILAVKNTKVLLHLARAEHDFAHVRNSVHACTWNLLAIYHLTPNGSVVRALTDRHTHRRLRFL